jgi:hypothetical protein
MGEGRRVGFGWPEVWFGWPEEKAVLKFVLTRAHTHSAGPFLAKPLSAHFFPCVGEIWSSRQIGMAV